jgi:hypothetical protein
LTTIEEQAFEALKVALCDCVNANLSTTEWGRPFGIHCDSDSSKITVGSCLAQWNTDGIERPIAFASAKLSGVSWAAIKRETYAIIWSFNKFCTWIFVAPITLFVDSNPLTYLIASAPKSAKPTR